MNIAKIFNKLSEAEQAEFLGKLDRNKHERVFVSLFGDSDTTCWKLFFNEDTYESDHSSTTDADIETAKRIESDHRRVWGSEQSDATFYIRKTYAAQIRAEVEAELAEV